MDKKVRAKFHRQLDIRLAQIMKATADMSAAEAAAVFVAALASAISELEPEQRVKMMDLAAGVLARAVVAPPPEERIHH